VKIAIVGGGSVQWMPTIVRDLAVTPGLADCHIVLEDVEPRHLELTLPMSRRILDAAGSGCTVEATTDRSAALDDAEFVILTISTGGLDAMRRDLEIPARYGVYQAVGDTVGPGGIFRALRSVPVVVGIAREMEAVCPRAWLLNYSNPMSALCRAVSKATSVRAVGLCHELYGCLRMLREILGLDSNGRLDYRVAGINHLIFIVELRVDGRDGFALLRDFLREHPDYRRKAVPPESAHYPFSDRALLKLELFGELGVLPAAGDRHTAEFFPDYLTDETDRGRRYGIELTTIAHRRALMDESSERAARIAHGDEAVDLEPSEEAAARIIDALANGTAYTDVVNLPNAGQIANLPRDAVVETLATVAGGRIVPDQVGDLPPAIQPLLERHIRIQEMAVEAALAGDRALALEAFRLDPLIPNADAGRRMFDELFAAHAALLPQFR
jgi:alpha-galactosidase/6-phospho-beta-glucosidase family protein